MEDAALEKLSEVLEENLSKPETKHYYRMERTDRCKEGKQEEEVEIGPSGGFGRRGGRGKGG